MKTAGRWVVTADLQFDEHASLSTLTPSGVTSRLKDMIDCWHWIMATAIKRNCEGIIVIGDIFDSRTVIDLSVLDQVCRGFHAAHEKGLRLIIVAGNHDSYLRSPKMNSLQVFKGYAQVVEVTHVEDGMGFVAWTEDITALRSGIDTVLKGGAKYLFTHVLLRGAVTGGDKGVPVDALRPEKFEQVFLGDVHDPREITENVRYVGSPLQINYGDAGGWRGIVVFDRKSGEIETVENTVSPKFHVIEDATVEGVKSNDFVRVKTDDPEIAAEAEAAAKVKTGWVESTFVEKPDIKPRLDVRTSHAHEVVLARYCTHQGIEEVDSLVKVGMEIIEEAKHG